MERVKKGQQFAREDGIEDEKWASFELQAYAAQSNLKGAVQSLDNLILSGYSFFLCFFFSFLSFFYI